MLVTEGFVKVFTEQFCYTSQLATIAQNNRKLNFMFLAKAK